MLKSQPTPKFLLAYSLISVKKIFKSTLYERNTSGMPTTGQQSVSCHPWQELSMLIHGMWSMLNYRTTLHHHWCATMPLVWSHRISTSACWLRVSQAKLLENPCIRIRILPSQVALAEGSWHFWYQNIHTLSCEETNICFAITNIACILHFSVSLYYQYNAHWNRAWPTKLRICSVILEFHISRLDCIHTRAINFFTVSGMHGYNCGFHVR